MDIRQTLGDYGYRIEETVAALLCVGAVGLAAHAALSGSLETTVAWATAGTAFFALRAAVVRVRLAHEIASIEQRQER